MKYEEFTHERPLWGYGTSPVSPKWPGGAKVALVFVIEYSEGGESSVEYGDKRSEALHTEILNDISRPDRDDFGESEWEYGPRAGLPRLLRMFKKYDYKGTINVVTDALAKSEIWTEEIRKSGWEISCGGKRWLDYMHVSPEIEDSHIKDAIQFMKGLGVESLGFSIERRSNYSPRLYAQGAREAGIPLAYSADSFADELPYWLTSPLACDGEDEGLLVIPTALDTSDIRCVVNGQGFGTGADFAQYLKDTLDGLMAEAKQGFGRMMTVTLHPRLAGHGSRAYYVEEFLEYVSHLEGVLVTSRAEIAQHWRTTFPYSREAAHDLIKVPANIDPYDVGSSLPDSAFKKYLPPRDFTGYGPEGPRGPEIWPGNAKIAVSFVLNFEEGAEHSLWNGDSRSEQWLNEANYWRLPVEGRRDMYTESLYDYGVRCGAPRIIRLFQEFRWPMTVWANSRALEASSQYGKLLADLGHEVAAHGNRWITQTELSGPAEEYAHVKQGIQRIQDATGRANLPEGYFLGRGSLYSKYLFSKAHKELGVPLLYCSDSYADDLPYWLEDPLSLDGEPDQGLLVVPYGLTNNDHKWYSKGAGPSVAEDWFNILKGDFEVLYKEGKEGAPKMMTIALHNRIIGRPGRLAGLRMFMEHIATRPDVWVTTRADIARHWKSKYPYKGPLRTHRTAYI